MFVLQVARCSFSFWMFHGQAAGEGEFEKFVYSDSSRTVASILISSLGLFILDYKLGPSFLYTSWSLSHNFIIICCVTSFKILNLKFGICLFSEFPVVYFLFRFSFATYALGKYDGGLIFFFFKNFSKFVFERVEVGKYRERETKNLKQLSAQSLTQELNLRTLRSQPEPKSGG